MDTGIRLKHEVTGDDIRGLMADLMAAANHVGTKRSNRALLFKAHYYIGKLATRVLELADVAHKAQQEHP